LQKPSPAAQANEQAINAYGQSVLDVGVFSLDAAAAVRLLELCDARADGSGGLVWSGPMGGAIERYGLDFYREIGCAFGTETGPDAYLAAAHSGGSRWDDALLRRIFDSMHSISLQAQVLRRCEFLHFGTSRQIIESGQQLHRSDAGFASASTAAVCINNRLDEQGAVSGGACWIEGCAIRQAVTLAGENLLVGVDVDGPLELPPRACLDLLPGRNRAGQPITFIRCYGIDDPLPNPSGETGTLCGQPLSWWADPASGAGDALWDAAVRPHDRSLWNARLFPAEVGPDVYRRWLWMFDPVNATAEQLDSWRRADRYSLEEMAALADQEAFHDRRLRLHADAMQGSLCRWFRHESRFSAADLAQVLSMLEKGDNPHLCEAPSGPLRQMGTVPFFRKPEAWLAAVLQEARRREEPQPAESAEEMFSFARTIHTLGSALEQLPGGAAAAGPWLDRLRDGLDPEMHAWLAGHGLELNEKPDAEHWAGRARSTAFAYLRRKIVSSGRREDRVPRNALRSDEIAWGRAPARLDLTGGWTDTPPYALEHGGTVLNAAVLLNGQPPVQVHARVTAEPIIRVRSIDLGTHLDIHGWDELFDYSSAVGEFSLVKAALVISGFTPLSGGSERNRPLRDVLASFGGGIELTTLAAIPKGSGLGTSSIMGAVLMAVIHRMMGRTLTPTELFHAVLRLEQELTTGGGWQDQIGGAVGGLKLTTTKPGLVPEPTIRYVPADVLDPRLNAGRTLLYYTGMTRLAKNILQNVVGRYLDRDREAMSALAQLGALAARMAEAMGRKDQAEFGQLIDTAWQLNKQLDPHSTTGEIEALLTRIRSHIHGAKLLGAGGGGFLLIVAKSPSDAACIARLFEESPPNPRARFFEFQVSDTGLAVSVC
jgi:galactokinase/mevalonate kinase-like predicted kinase